MYVKCDTVTDAQEVFDGMAFRDVISWTTIITGFAHNDAAEAAIEMFREMQSSKASLNAVNILCSTEVLQCCRRH
jgi:pentatricopeptide repeat protein